MEELVDVGSHLRHVPENSVGTHVRLHHESLVPRARARRHPGEGWPGQQFRVGQVHLVVRRLFRVGELHVGFVLEKGERFGDGVQEVPDACLVEGLRGQVLQVRLGFLAGITLRHALPVAGDPRPAGGNGGGSAEVLFLFRDDYGQPL